MNISKGLLLEMQFYLCDLKIDDLKNFPQTKKLNIRKSSKKKVLHLIHKKRNNRYPGKGGGNLATPSLYLFLNIFIFGSKSRHNVFLKRVLAFQLP